ncbi:MAG TPA: O-antigen ligase family protein [Solirubrobacteraceae bacterium]|jgi:O-antigen ligase|nr:O-antigen ligase family protein [Solirubrobacteraceae bacterium]
MVARRLGLGRGELAAAVLASAVTLLIALLATRKAGTAGLLAPLAIVAGVILLHRPVLLVGLVVALAAVCEGPTFGLLHFSSHLYDQIYKGLTPLDILVALAIVAVGIDLIVRRRRPRLPRALAPGLVMLVLAMIAGAVTGHAAGASVRSVVLSENVLAYLLLLPLAISNLALDRRQVSLLLGGAVALAIVKAGLGLVEVAGHYGESIEGNATLTYYEPAANWLIMIALLATVAAIVGRARLPLWMLLGTPLLVASLVLSYRRSFWIASVLGLLLVLLLGLTPAGRRLLVPVGLAIAFAILLLGSINFQAQLPIVKRAESLAPTSLEANAEDRYRLDERANVLAEIGRHPITGLGMKVPWEANVQPLSVEHEEGREYVHFAVLWYWLKLGILGLFAYMSLLLGSALLAWRVWRASEEPMLRAFGLASLCGLAGLVVIETTASFTGVDPRFTVLLSAQVGLLALLARSSAMGGSEPSEAPIAAG